MHLNSLEARSEIRKERFFTKESDVGTGTVDEGEITMRSNASSGIRTPMWRVVLETRSLRIAMHYESIRRGDGQFRECRQIRCKYLPRIDWHWKQHVIVKGTGIVLQKSWYFDSEWQTCSTLSLRSSPRTSPVARLNRNSGTSLTIFKVKLQSLQT